MCDGKSNVLVEMKGFNFAPVNPRLANERVQELELRGACRRNDSCVAVKRNRLTNCRGRVVRRSLAQRLVVIEYLQHGVTSRDEINQNHTSVHLLLGVGRETGRSGGSTFIDAGYIRVQDG